MVFNRLVEFTMNRKMITMFLLSTLAVLLIVFIVILSIQMGRKPKGERLDKITQNNNYNDGIFQNTEETNMDSPPMEGIKEMMKKKPNQTPSSVVHTNIIDKTRFEKAAINETIVCWLGHSSFIIKTGGVTVLVDPVFSQRASMFQFIGPHKFNYSVDYQIEDLPKIDVVLISHDHYDHLDYRAIKELNKTVDHFYMPLGVGSHFDHWNINSEKIKEVNWWDSVDLNGVTFTATPGRHFTGRFVNDRFKTLWCGWGIKSETSNVYYSGDSGYFEGFKQIGEKLGPFDFALMECGQYSKYWPNIHMFPEESAQAAIDAKVKIAMPIHWGKFKLSIHTWTDSPERFLEKSEELNLPVSTPEIGQVFSIDELQTQRWWNN